MKSLRIFLISLSFGLFIMSCQKEHTTTTNTTVGSPVFYFNGTVGGNNVSLQAGKSNYYMYSSYTQDKNNVYNYIANLKEFNCNSVCSSSIEFIINDYRSLPVGASENNVGNSLFTGNFGYSTTGHSVTKYSILYTPSIVSGSAPVKSFTFDYGDGTDTTGSKLPNRFTHTYSAFAHYKTFLTVVFSDSSSSIVPLISNFTPKDSTSYAPSSMISDTIKGGGQIEFVDNVYGGITGTIFWNFGDSGTSSGAYNSSTNNVTHSYNTTKPHNTIYNVTAAIKNSVTNDTIFSTMSLRPLSAKPIMDIANYTASAPIITANPYNFSNVTIIYTDPSGDIYTTADSVQPGGSNFQIVSVASYNNNENNQTTKQLHIKFNCTLYDNIGKSLNITDGDAVIAVAYK
jgi:hypothetical protein